MASELCKEALKLLTRSRNLLISGPPGTGKSKLLAEVAKAFESGFGITATGGAPHLNPVGGIPIPPAPGGNVKDIPSPTRSNRRVFRTVFHQNSKYRDFLSGITPTINRVAGGTDFSIVKGTLYRASEHAKLANSASLLIIDEINRGPAVQIFGGAIVAMEPDKRLQPDGLAHEETQFFEILDPVSGEVVEYALPHDLYIVAAMNQADASVEPLDVAFLRRWEPLRLEPDEKELRNFYGLGVRQADPLPNAPINVANVLEASTRAWVAINEQIALGRGSEFRIGHGVLMLNANFQALTVPEVLEVLCIGWAKIRAHIDEVFFGDLRGIAAVLNALDGPASNPFRLTETTFADDLRFNLEGPTNFNVSNVYDALRSFARE